MLAELLDKRSEMPSRYILPLNREYIDTERERTCIKYMLPIKEVGWVALSISDRAHRSRTHYGEGMTVCQNVVVICVCGAYIAT